MVKWTPDIDVELLLDRFGFPIRNHSMHDLYNDAQLYLDTKWYKLGVTLTRYIVVFNVKILDYPFTIQAAEIMHELTHVAQYIDYGWPKFVFKYTLEWLKAGCSYQKMKQFGLEKEAYDVEAEFRRRVAQGESNAFT